MARLCLSSNSVADVNDLVVNGMIDAIFENYLNQITYASKSGECAVGWKLFVLMGLHLAFCGRGEMAKFLDQSDKFSNQEIVSI